LAAADTKACTQSGELRQIAVGARLYGRNNGCARCGFQAHRRWAYLPDLAQTILRLLSKQATFGNFETFHFAGHWLPRSIEVAESIRRAVGDPRLPICQLPWPLVTLVAPFVAVLREVLEMRYLWREPLRLLGSEAHTPLDEAVKTSLGHLGCLLAGA
jgi:nucleoside-diphosphate-sugar epimerase